MLFVLWFLFSISAQENTITPSAEIESLLEKMKLWPTTSAKKASQLLIEKKKEALPHLLIGIKTGTVSLKVACAYCLGQLKHEPAFADIVALTKDNSVRPHLETVFTALVRINADKAYPVLLNFLQSPNQTGHGPAMKLLEVMTSEKHIKLLEGFSKSKSDTCRKYAIQLLGLLPLAKSQPFLLSALKDPSPYVTLAAVQTLGKADSSELRTKLLGYVGHHDRRFLGYVSLVILEQEDNFQISLFERRWIPELLQAVRQEDYFIKGCAAACLVNVGFQSNDVEISSVMDKYLAPTLIDVVSGKVYYRDYLALRNIAYRKLKQLTGKDLGSNMDAWWEWWHKNNHQFQAVRLLKGISEDQIKGLSLEYISEGNLENIQITLVALPEMVENMPIAKDVKPFVFQRPLVLNWRQLNSLLTLLHKIQFLHMPAEQGILSESSHKITLNLQNYRKIVKVYGNSWGILEPLILQVLEFRNENIWQHYWDMGQDKDWQKWYQSEEKWFVETENKELRLQRTKRLLLISYASLGIPQKDEAVLHFLKMMQQNPDLSDSMINWAISHIRSEGEINHRSETLLKALLLAKNENAIMPLVDFLVLNYSPKARTLLEGVFAISTDRMLYQYIKHPNPYARSGAAQALGQRKAEEMTVMYLIVLLRDEHILVQQSAIQSLGELKVADAWDHLFKILENPNYQTILRQSALLSLSKISPEKANSIILQKMSSPETELRSAVIQALVEIGGITSVQSLQAFLCGDPSPSIREMSALSLTQISPQDAGIASLLEVAIKFPRPETQILAIRALQKTSSLKKLIPLLQHNNPTVQIETAIALAEVKEMATIPILIQNADNPQYSTSARRSLERLTLVSFSDENPGKRYLDWWNVHKDVSTDQWILEAMRVRGYPMQYFLDYLLDGEKNPKMVLIWLQALGDKDWFIRAMANDKLMEYTGVSFGTLHFYSGTQTSQELLRLWRNWYQKNMQKN